MWIFPNLPQNVDKFPIPRDPGPVTKMAVTALQSFNLFIMFISIKPYLPVELYCLCLYVCTRLQCISYSCYFANLKICEMCANKATKLFKK